MLWQGIGNSDEMFVNIWIEGCKDEAGAPVSNLAKAPISIQLWWVFSSFPDFWIGGGLWRIHAKSTAIVFLSDRQNVCLRFQKPEVTDRHTGHKQNDKVQSQKSI